MTLDPHPCPAAWTTWFASPKAAALAAWRVAVLAATAAQWAFNAALAANPIALAAIATPVVLRRKASD